MSIHGPATPLEALELVIKILEKHPTNKHRLSSGEEGYDSRCRYAYLEAREAVRKFTKENK